MVIPSQHLWTLLCRWHQRVFKIIEAIILSLIPAIIIFSVTAPKDYHPGPLVDWILHHPWITVFLTITPLLLLAGIFIYVEERCRQDAAQMPAVGLPLPTQRDRLMVVQILRQEYIRRQDDALRGTAMVPTRLDIRRDITLSLAQPGLRRPDIASITIMQVFDEAVQGLLILGEPGVGKTTLLRKLALELLERAEGDPAQPMPVILNLSSWAEKRPRFDTWLIEQLWQVYGISYGLSQPWLEHHHWLLLLDGLEEVADSARFACIEAINAYRREHSGPLVVCSQSRAYLSQEKRLNLSSAVVVQFLDKGQVMDYLKSVGRPTAAARAALRANPVLQELISTPFMLQVVIAIYRDKKVKDIPQLGSAKEQQQQIFESYVQQMLSNEQPGDFTPQQTRRWLNWLAQQMQQRQFTEFYLERLQPSWLSTKQAGIIYILLVNLLFGLVVGLGLGMAIGLVIGPGFGLTIGLVVGLSYRLGYGLGARPEIKEPLPTEVLVWSWKGFWRWLFFGLILAFGFWLIAGLAGLIIGLGFGLFFGLFFGLSGEPTTAALSHHSYLKYIVLPVFNLLRAHCRDVTYLDRQSLHGSQPRVSHCVSKSGVVWALNLRVPW